MPILSEKYIKGLAPLIGPYEGHPKKTIENDLLEGEGHNDEFLELIHNGQDNQHPQAFVQVTLTEVSLYQLDKGGSFAAKAFLWVIDSVSVKILWELTPNARRGPSRPDKPYVCHTNITGSGKAYIGGEMYFCEDGRIFLNFSSDRYGRVATNTKKQAAIQYIRDCGYEVINVEDNIGL